ncbi:molybdopterin-dependent oxidoreductase [Candidatus Bathyarchaeota archaeon]|nr:molybdopterin-dependent oxidoreductase [Candidatus Bathyarchaeota archaeon]
MKPRILIFALLIAAAFTGAHPVHAQEEPVIRVYGAVDNPVNITYSEFLRLPMTSVNVSCICVGAPPDNPGLNSFVVYTYNWTGVRVSDILDLVEAREEAVDAVFRDDTQYSSSLPVEALREPEMIIAVYADGEPLNREQGAPFRLVAPCWWGYKWVKFITRIEVVDYDHLGFWESHGYPDDARIPGCTFTVSNPVVFTAAAQGVAVLGLSLVALGLYLNRARV